MARSEVCLFSAETSNRSSGRAGPFFRLTVMTESGLCVTLLVAKSSMFNGKLSYRDR